MKEGFCIHYLSLTSFICSDLKLRREKAKIARHNAEQIRRDQLREAYSRLQEVVPDVSERTSKIRIIDGACICIKTMRTAQDKLNHMLAIALDEVDALRR